MQKSIRYKEVDVVYHDRGKGRCIVLLHGYLETLEVWEGFTEKLLDRFRVLTIDLPGHGKSGTWGEVHSMEDLAGAVRAVLQAENTGKIFLAGHSMGGYVTMAFVENYREMLFGYALFHSTCFADSEEKKGLRDREISLVLCHKKRQIINVNIPKGFAADNLQKLRNQVNRIRELAHTNTDQGIVAILNGMKQRPDRTSILQDAGIPLLLIGGMKDNYIPPEVFERLVHLAPQARVLRLENSGHMGFIEEPDLAADAIREMAES